MTRVLAVGVLVLALVSPHVWAGPVTVGVWTSVAAGTPVPFWDNPSWDGSPVNDLRTLVTPYAPDLEWLHDGAGGPVPVAFADSDGGFILLEEVAGYADFNALWWASASTTGLVWAGPTSPLAMAFIAGIGSPIWFMAVTPEGVFDSHGSGFEHFAWFRSLASGDYWLALEDKVDPTDWDYNDQITRLRDVAPSVPEPGTLVLLGAGLFGWAWRLRASR